MFVWCVYHLKSADYALKYISDWSQFVCRSPLIAYSFVTETNGALHLKGQFSCHYCTKNRSGIDSICCAVVPFLFSECQKQSWVTTSAWRATNMWLQNLSSLVRQSAVLESSWCQHTCNSYVLGELYNTFWWNTCLRLFLLTWEQNGPVWYEWT